MIKAKQLCKSFDDLNVLDNFDLEIQAGETLVILGASGVGKSVFLKHIIGLIQPDSGSLEIDGVNITELRGQSLYEAIRNTGMLFQGGALFDSLNIFQNVSFYLDQHEHLTFEETQERVCSALKMVGLEETEEKMPAELSGGMRKRAALARLIVYRPRILLYDEPTTGLDPIHSMQINELIVQTQKELNATSVVVTHDIASTLKIADRIALLHEGRIIFIGNKESFIKSQDETIHKFISNAIPKGVFSNGSQ
ncbi:MAG: putative ribonucleotide transport ATP-binding protein mkl [Chlamydiae bacterium]|nr:putative ribonucleotide transport ATP-binding protein mkl [Chlamydiota bacterium]